MKIEMLRHVLIISEFTQQEDRRKEEDGKTLGSDKRDSPITYVFCQWSSLKLMFSGLLQRLFKGVWIACERQTFLLADCRWGTFREKEPPCETSLSGDERGETSVVRRLEGDVRRKSFSNKIIVTLVTQGLPSCFLSRPVAWAHY